MSLHRKGQLSRADLIVALLKSDQPSFDYLTGQLGLFKQPEVQEERVQVESSVQSTSQPAASHEVAPFEAGLKPGMGFWALHRREKTAQKTQVETTSQSMPLDWSMHSSPPAKHHPLASPRAILPRSLRHLKHQSNSREIDVAAIVRKISRGEHLNRLPRNKRRSLGSYLHLIDDRHLHLTPYWLDHALFSNLFENLLPDYASSRAVLHDGGSLPVSIDPEGEISDWVLPPEGSVVIVFSDLGALSTQPLSQVDAWLDIARLLTQRDCKLIALIPCRPEECDARLKSLFILEPWEKAHPLPGAQAGAWAPGREERNAAVEKLLTLLSPAIRLEPSLLRCIRKKLVQKGIYMDAGVEAMVWQHPAMLERSSVAATFGSDARKLWLERFYLEEESLREMVLETLRSWRSNLEPVWFEEIASLNEASRQGVPQADIQVAAHYFQKLIVQSESGLELTADADTQSWLGRLEKRLPQEACHSQDVGPILQEIIAQRHKNDESYHTQHALNPALLSPVNAQPKNAVLYQQGECIRLGSGLKADWIGHSPLASISYKRSLLYIEQEGPQTPLSEIEKKRSQSFLFQPNDLESRKVCALADIEGLMIRSDMESLYFKQIPKPGWAISMGRDQHGLFVTAPWLNEPKLYWQERLIDWADNDWWSSSWTDLVGHWSGHEFLGVDEYGFYADLDIKGVVQRFRWIEPGTFLMGSPKDEVGRWEDEAQHEVTLTQGFWLADTTVTQALWLALMDNNPSEFKESGNHPVENVSWNDAQDFISKLNETIPGINAQLPSEAQWEYACRAGTQTAFNLEGELSLDKVNYRGTRDARDKWGEGAHRKTVDVKSYGCNGWGLYQMHGNVWEWCQDFWAERLPTEPVINPKGPDEGTLRVVRGGSWIRDGRDARSASRLRFDVIICFDYFGFRLALDLEHQSSQAGAFRVSSGGRDEEQRRPMVVPKAKQLDKLVRIKDKIKKLWKDNV